MSSECILEEQVANPKREYNDVPQTRFTNSENDFSREIIANNIIEMLDSGLTDCYPMAIDGGWGTGKSEFCHKLINKMRDSAESCEKRNIIYFDAFEAENVEEPLLSLLAKITEVVPEAEKKPLISKIVPVAKYGLGVTLKGLANHILRQNGDALSEGFHEAFADGVTSGIDKLLKEYSQAKTHLQSLKDCIEQALKTKELVIFIDELDRCRPDFALNVFELVKHVFDIEGVKFIFVFNSDQIKSMIKNRYGNSMDCDIYLEKFIKKHIYLQKNNLTNDIDVSIEYYKILISQTNIEILKSYENDIFDIVRLFIVRNNISLRAIENLISNIKIFSILSKNAFSSKNSDGINIFTMFGILIATFNKSLAEKIINNNVYYSDITSVMNGKFSHEQSTILDFLYMHINLISLDWSTKRFINNSKSLDYLDKIFPKEEKKREYTGIIKDVIKTLNFCG